jgi:outer membrane protein assembly factor BamE (lipoprotein component of BamABCDE complex)
MIKRSLISLFFYITLISCNNEKVLNTHGIAYLEKREKLIDVNKSNKNDVIDIFGTPATKGMVDENIWIYIERTKESGNIIKLGKKEVIKNNILVLEFNRYGVLQKKELFDKEKMNNLKFNEQETTFEGKKENFIYSFLSSVRQKMLNQKKKF